MNFTLYLRPGATEPINFEGDFFAIVQCASDVFVKLPGQTEVLYGQGDSFTLPAGQIFKRIEIRNPTAQPLVAVIYAGQGRYEQRRQAVIEPRTRVVGRSDTLAGLSTLDLSPTLLAQDIRRKYVVVSNPDTSLKLELVDETGVRFQIIEPTTSAIVHVSERFGLKNPNGSPVQYSVG